MLPCSQSDTPPSIARPDYISYTSLQLLKSSLLLLQIDPPCMASNIHRRPVGQHSPWPSDEQSAYQTSTTANPTPNLANAQRTSPAQQYFSQPPASPTSDKKQRMPSSLRSLIRRKPESDAPRPQQPPMPDSNSYFPSRPSTQQGGLTPYSYYQPAQSTPALTVPSLSARSMPPSPMDAPSSLFTRSVSAHVVSPTSPQDRAPQSYRHSSYEPSFEPQPVRARRTFPETQFDTPVATTAPSSSMQYQEPEALADAAQYRLFVEATSGLPPGFLDMQSPLSPPGATPSLFIRTSQTLNPAPVSAPVLDLSSPHSQPHSYSRAQPQYPAQHQTSGSYGYSSQSQRIADELERLSGDEDNHDDDELPNYAQSQAEMHESRRAEAARRAAELERSWRSRGRR
ncbi:uncharacterized protein BDZ99DRAFT_8417 [Mytilinidion resinicola]|uniref:Uncharacterized protein n=1 Tax=Mytilinidion resinicola TaxID=574789 RepID=A0A6A6Z9W4_9PEZI|nr:uncharacterized protein BDZ99DRAFT_8417 [Mytilinidion resinicola]KAF2817074.1 hypothetical protein BDZ99DRAFT_8417 [Mytilinidion resinicola]